jgi:TPR repeat protein
VTDRQSKLDDLFRRADAQWEAGNLKAAFRLFLLAAKGGDYGCQVNLGNFYSDGIGVKPNRAKATYWYKRAYRHGCGAAASNIACVYRDVQKLKQALAWYERAVKLRLDDANLEIAKIFLKWNDKARAIRYLKRTLKAKDLAESSKDEALRLLKRLM